MSPREQAEEFCNEYHHEWIEEYYGYRCANCAQFITYGCEPWIDEPYDYEEYGDF